MARYDCRNCGERNGIAWGFCRSCTPDEVIIAKQKLKDARRLATDEFNSEYREIKDKYIDFVTKELSEKYNQLVEKHKPNL